MSLMANRMLYTAPLNSIMVHGGIIILMNIEYQGNESLVK